MFGVLGSLFQHNTGKSTTKSPQTMNSAETSMKWTQISGLFLLLCSQTTPAATWQTAYETGFEGGDWQRQWTLSGGGGAKDQKALLSQGSEFQARLIQKFDAPAIRVEFDAAMLDENKDGQFSDLSVFVGDVFFQFGGESNT
ncbi:MAG: hypothetical protein HY360_08930, partial [Verrucomicrobia bacterium]|nr:hypothetical protein [Verrucomicrobiota bacterium]